jgi:polyisoprenoid-binding protein YceI
VPFRGYPAPSHDPIKRPGAAPRRRKVEQDDGIERRLARTLPALAYGARTAELTRLGGYLLREFHRSCGQEGALQERDSMKYLVAPTAIVLALATSAIAAEGFNTNPAAVEAGAYTVEPTHTRVQFAVSHMGFTTFYGDFTGVGGSLTLDPKDVAASKVDITIPVASVSTTNHVLDGELKSGDWLDATTYPTMHFVSTKVVRTTGNRATITGNLTLHGVTRPVALAATFNGSGINPLDRNYTVGFDATTALTRSQFGVKTYLPMVGDKTTLRISAAFEKSK